MIRRRRPPLAAAVEAIRRENHDATIELLLFQISDARPELLDTVAAAKPDIIGHNIETVERLTPQVQPARPLRDPLRTLELLARRGAATKSGLMLGLGEKR